MSCSHSTLFLDPSPHATTAGFRRATNTQRLAATTLSGKTTDVTVDSAVPSSIFPGPLVLPGDDLSNDPRCPPQSFRSWVRSKDRNEVTSNRNVMYVAAPPDIQTSASFMQTWTQVNILTSGSSRTVSPPSFVSEVMDYLKAFYTGFTVKPLTSPSLRFESWNDATAKSHSSSSTKRIPQYVGLNIGQEMVGIRARPSPDRVFPAQLSVDDLIEAAISSLPPDAYCLLLIVNQDIYEGEDDAFVCGRAYGGSRVAVVSTARYNPSLDGVQNIQREHAWPASHCREFVQKCQSDEIANTRPQKKTKRENDPVPTGQDHPLSAPSETLLSSPMYAALKAYKGVPNPNGASVSATTLSGLWLGRICRTASHELGHCFGVEHCVYYACVMQSSSNISEDLRQPPYLCPVDLVKVLRSSGPQTQVRERAHYQALLEFCERHTEAQMFAAFAGWLRARLALTGTK